MPSIAGKYQDYKHEDLSDYMTALGVPYVAGKMMEKVFPLMEIALEGQTMTIKTILLTATSECTFKLGEEYEERTLNDTLKSLTILINDHEVQTNSVIVSKNMKFGRHYLFTDDECIMTLIHEKSKPGKRYFKRVK